MKRILCIFGTRPDVIKMAPVIHALKARPDVEVISCDTGQHRELATPVLEWFGIRCDHKLGLMAHNQGLSALMARALEKIDEVIAGCSPDILVCQGDTTTAAAAALAAFHRQIPVAHVEAGLRTGNPYSPWPEEINRRGIDLVAHHFFAPTESAADALRLEGIPAAKIHMTGNTSIDALLWTLKRVERDRLYDSGYPPGTDRPFILITAHRRESFGSGLQAIAEALVTLAGRFPEIDWIFPVHPNPAVRAVMHQMLAGVSNIKLLEPLDYPRFCWLLARCKLVMTDSGGIQEEAPVLGKPVLVLRDVTERPEGVGAGAAKLVGCTTPRIVEETAWLLTSESDLQKMAVCRNLYGDGSASERIADILTRGGGSTGPLFNSQAG